MIDVPDYNHLKELDHSCFKAVLSAAMHLNFTQAAKQAGMTQSGVSQQIAKLEEQIGAQLFLRINKSVILTETGKKLLNYIESQQDHLSSFFDEVGKETATLTGSVRYAMPHSCLFTPHFPLIIEARKNKFSLVQLDVQLCPNPVVIDSLLNNTIDFGFVTEMTTNPGLHFIKFATEEYILVGPKTGKSKAYFSLGELMKLPFLDYPGMNVLFDIWAKENSFSKKINYEQLKITGRINSLHGIVTMLVGGMGWTILPSHVVASELKDHMMSEYTHENKSKKVFSDIYIVTTENHVQPQRVTAVIDSFLAMKK